MPRVVSLCIGHPVKAKTVRIPQPSCLRWEDVRSYHKCRTSTGQDRRWHFTFYFVQSVIFNSDFDPQVLLQTKHHNDMMAGSLACLGAAGCSRCSSLAFLALLWSLGMKMYANWFKVIIFMRYKYISSPFGYRFLEQHFSQKKIELHVV